MLDPISVKSDLMGLDTGSDIVRSGIGNTGSNKAKSDVGDLGSDNVGSDIASDPDKTRTDIADIGSRIISSRATDIRRRRRAR